jgi:hypothetical protein
MKKIILFTMFAGVLALFNTGCKKKNDPAPSGTSAYYFEADIDGVHTVFVWNDAVKVNSSPSYIDIEGAREAAPMDTTFRRIRVRLLENSGVGTYSLSYSSPFRQEGLYEYGDDYGTHTNASGTGTTTITKISSTEIEGSFSFKAYSYSRNVNITNGRFKVPIQ